MRKTEKQEKRLKEALGIANKRGNTFVGFRPTVFSDKRYTKKNTRQARQALQRSDREEW